VLLDAIPLFEASDMQSGVFFPQHIVIVRLHALLLDPTLGIFVLFTRHKRIVAIVLLVRLKAALSAGYQWLSNVFDQRRSGARVYFHQR
jgi:hypothetical protein